MGKRARILVAAALAFLGAACTRTNLTLSPDSGAPADAVVDSRSTVGAGGATDLGAGGATGNGGSSGTGFVLPDGGLLALLGDSEILGGILDAGLLGGILDAGLLGGILDASRDNLLGQVICDSNVKTGDACSSTTALGCILPSLGGACVCVNGAYLCPRSTVPEPCPASAATGVLCLSPLSTCIGGTASACVCGLGTYTCF